MLERRRRALQHVDGLPKPNDRIGAVIGQRHRPQGDADPPRRAPATRPIEVFESHPTSRVDVAHRGQRQRGMRAPARGQRVGEPPRLVASTELDQIVQALARPSLGEAQQTPRFEQVHARRPGRDLSVEPAVAQLPLGGIELAALDQRLDQRAERERNPERDPVRRENLECRPPVGFSRRHRPAPQGNQSPTGRQVGHRQDRRLGLGAREHLSDVRLGEVQGLGGDQSDRKVERESQTDQAGLLISRRTARRQAHPRGGQPLRAPSRWPSSACWRGWREPGARRASTRRDPRSSAPAVAPPGPGFRVRPARRASRSLLRAVARAPDRSVRRRRSRPRAP